MLQWMAWAGDGGRMNGFIIAGSKNRIGALLAQFAS
jgi:hypothetical protein